jgi:signal transduction histidine kinase
MRVAKVATRDIGRPPRDDDETRTRMSAGKYPRSDGERKLAPRAPRPPARRVEPAPSPAAQEKVIAEIAHELGNFFHKLYYWSDYLKERGSRQSADSTAAQMLERTIKNLEDFLRVSLDYFHPTQLAPMRMSVPDIVGALLSQVRAAVNGTPIVVADHGDWNGAEVMVDPNRLSQAFEIAVRHVTKQLGADSALGVTIGRAVRRERPGVEVEFRLREPSEASPLFRTSEAGVEWAVAQKVVALHQGELTERDLGPGEKSLVMFLPLSR